MAVTKIWPVRNRMDQVIYYIQNPHKTTAEADDTPEALAQVVGYLAQEGKTEQGVYVTGIHCTPETAVETMRRTKQNYFKEGGIVAFHAYQSFAPGEVTPDTAHAIGVALAETLWGKRFEVVVATHLDRAHLHNHFVLNSVSFKDGLRYYDNRATYRALQETSDALCREYGLSVIETPEKGKSLHYSEWQARQQGLPTWRSAILSDIDATISESVTLKQFLYYLRQKGYAIKPNAKYFTLKPPGKERFVRIDRYDSAYSLPAIEARIRSQQKVKQYRPPKNVKSRRMRLGASFGKGRKFSGLRGLYMHYCFKIGLFPKRQAADQAYLHFLYREDVRQLETINAETLFLCHNHIETNAELTAAREERQKTLMALTKRRKQLANRLRYVQTPQAVEAIRQEKKAISQQIKKLRHDIKCCDGIEARQSALRKKIANVTRDQSRVDKQRERSGRNHEYWR